MTLSTHQASFNDLVVGIGTDYDIERWDGLGMPLVRATDIPRLDRDGSFKAARELVDPRTVSLEIVALGEPGEDVDELATALVNAFVRSETTMPLTFNLPVGFNQADTGDPDRRVNCHVRRRNLIVGQEEGNGALTFYVQLEAQDPRVYEEVERSESVGLSDVTGGKSYPYEYPYGYGSVTPGQVTAVNYGNVDTYPTAVINGPVTNPKLELTETGEVLDFQIDIADGSFLEVNFQDRTVLLGGTANRFSTLREGYSFFGLRPDPLTNTVNFSGTSVGAPTMDLTWRSAWL